MAEGELNGWRVIVTGHTVAMDNRPATDAAKAEGRHEPTPQSAVIPIEVLNLAHRLWEQEHGVVQPTPIGGPETTIATEPDEELSEKGALEEELIREREAKTRVIDAEEFMAGPHDEQSPSGEHTVPIQEILEERRGQIDRRG